MAHAQGSDDLEMQGQPNQGQPVAVDDGLPTIKRVPNALRALDQGRYMPDHVCIGPYHRQTTSLLCEAVKNEYRRQIFNMYNGQSAGTQGGDDRLRIALETLISSHLPTVPANEPPELVTGITTRGYYDYTDASCPPTMNDFAQMLLLDGCYLVVAVLFDTTEYLQGSMSRDLMVRDTWYILENQIPFFVLQEICNRVPRRGRAQADARRQFTQYACDLLKHTHQMCTGPREPPETIHHLLHLLHTMLKPSGSVVTDNGNQAAGQWHRATDYRKYANVEFKGRKIEEHDPPPGSVLDVRIEGRHVVIPCLLVDGNTWTILLNLMALERQHPSLGTHVTAYCLFMSQIACTKEDVELLEARGVIDRRLSTPESVAADFSRLCDAVGFDRSDSKANYLKPLWLNLDKRYKSRWHNVIAWLRLNYFTCRNISVLLGVVSALILLVAGVLSAVYQILSYKHQSRPSPSP